MNKNKRSDEKRIEEKLEERRTKKKKYFQERFIFQIRDFFLKRKVQKGIAPISKVSQKMFLGWKRKRDTIREKKTNVQKQKMRQNNLQWRIGKTFIFLSKMEYRNLFSLYKHQSKNWETKEETSTTESTNKEFQKKKQQRCCVLQSLKEKKVFPEIEKNGNGKNNEKWIL